MSRTDSLSSTTCSPSKISSRFSRLRTGRPRRGTVLIHCQRCTLSTGLWRRHFSARCSGRRTASPPISWPISAYHAYRDPDLWIARTCLRSSRKRQRYHRSARWIRQRRSSPEAASRPTTISRRPSTYWRRPTPSSTSTTSSTLADSSQPSRR